MFFNYTLSWWLHCWANQLKWNQRLGVTHLHALLSFWGFDGTIYPAVTPSSFINLFLHILPYLIFHNTIAPQYKAREQAEVNQFN